MKISRSKRNPKSSKPKEEEFTLIDSRSNTLNENQIETYYKFRSELTTDQMNQIVKKYLKNFFNIGDDGFVTVTQNFDREGPIDGFNVEVQIKKVTDSISIKRKIP